MPSYRLSRLGAVQTSYFPAVLCRDGPFSSLLYRPNRGHSPFSGEPDRSPEFKGTPKQETRCGNGNTREHFAKDPWQPSSQRQNRRSHALFTRRAGHGGSFQSIVLLPWLTVPRRWARKLGIFRDEAGRARFKTSALISCHSGIGRQRTELNAWRTTSSFEKSSCPLLRPSFLHDASLGMSQGSGSVQTWTWVAACHWEASLCRDLWPPLGLFPASADALDRPKVSLTTPTLLLLSLDSSMGLHHMYEPQSQAPGSWCFAVTLYCFSCNPPTDQLQAVEYDTNTVVPFVSFVMLILHLQRPHLMIHAVFRQVTCRSLSRKPSPSDVTICLHSLPDRHHGLGRQLGPEA